MISSVTPDASRCVPSPSSPSSPPPPPHPFPAPFTPPLSFSLPSTSPHSGVSILREPVGNRTATHLSSFWRVWAERVSRRHFRRISRRRNETGFGGGEDFRIFAPLGRQILGRRGDERSGGFAKEIQDQRALLDNSVKAFTCYGQKLQKG